MVYISLYFEIFGRLSSKCKETAQRTLPLRYLAQPASIRVAAGNQKDAADFIPVANEVEFYFYPKALKETGVESLAEALVFIQLGSNKCTLDLRDELFADQSYLQNFGQLTAKLDFWLVRNLLFAETEHQDKRLTPFLRQGFDGKASTRFGRERWPEQVVRFLKAAELLPLVIDLCLIWREKCLRMVSV